MPDFSALSKLFGGLKDLLSGIAGGLGSLGGLIEGDASALPPFMNTAS